MNRWLYFYNIRNIELTVEEMKQNQLAEALNRDCYCIAVDRVALRNSLAAHLRDSQLPDQFLDAHRNLFADSPVFLSVEHIEKMAQLIAAVERVSANSAYRARCTCLYPTGLRPARGVLQL